LVTTDILLPRKPRRVCSKNSVSMSNVCVALWHW